MNIPKELKIYGYTFSVTRESRLSKSGSETAGSFSLKNLKMWIDTDQHKEQQESTLIHEILEAIDEINDLKLSHSTICVLEAGLYQILKDNNLLRKGE